MLRKRGIAVCRTAALLLLGAAAVEAQLQLSVVSGRVLGPDGIPVRQAQVALLDALGQAIATTSSDDEGRFRLRGVAPGVYRLGAEAPTLRSPLYRLTVRDGRPLEVDVRLSPHVSESVAVAADANEPGGSSGTTLAGEAVRRAPAPLRGGALRAAVAATPGWMAEDNGLMHFRGVDDGLLFVLDGVPVYERLDPQFGAGFDPLTLGSVRVLSGYLPAEFGLRSGGVVDVRSQSGSIDSWSGLLEAGAGSWRSQALNGLLQGPAGGAASLMVTLGGERSRRFLDPVTLDNFHNEGRTAGGEAELSFAPGASLLTLRGGHARSAFDVPNDEDQEEAGQDQRQELAQTFATFNWQRSWSAATVSQLAVVGRFTTGQLQGSELDTPLFTDADRKQDRLGVLASVAQARGRHRLKGGLEVSRIRLDEVFFFFVTGPEEGKEADFSDGVLEHTEDNPFDFTDDARRTVISVYAQDSWRPLDALTVDFGLRYDHSRLLLDESQWSPRLGLSYRTGRTTFRASVNRLFQPPQTENLLLSSSPQAHELSPFTEELGEGGADIHAERLTAAEVGGEFWLGNAVRADVAVWYRWIENQGDPNVFLGTTVIFPNSVARGRARGLDVRLEMPRRAGFSGFATWTLAKVDQFGPINGGLFLEDDIIEIGPGTKFTPDHDIRHNLSAEVGYEDLGRGFWVSLAGRYRTGTPLEVEEEELPELAERPGSDLVDFEEQRTRPYAVFDVQAGVRLLRRPGFELSARGSLLNLTDARYAYNFGNPFSGTHFGAPRTVRIDLRLSMR